MQNDHNKPRTYLKELKYPFNWKKISNMENYFDFYQYIRSKFLIMEQKNLNRLRVIIAEKNLTNKWLSEQLGVGQATISKWVQNNAQPNLEMLIKLSKILDVDINELIRTDEVQIEP